MLNHTRTKSDETRRTPEMDIVNVVLEMSDCEDSDRHEKEMQKVFSEAAVWRAIEAAAERAKKIFDKRGK